jgi:hypothetical protein
MGGADAGQDKRVARKIRKVYCRLTKFAALAKWRWQLDGG